MDIVDIAKEAGVEESLHAVFKEHKKDIYYSFTLPQLTKFAELLLAGQWVSVKDRLPKDKSLVLGIGNHGQMPEDKITVVQVEINYLRGNWAKTAHSYPFNLTHWMPLPQPPKD